LWKVMKQRDVMQYGVVEEFVTSACETVPGLLTMRHQGKLALGLRARVKRLNQSNVLCILLGKGLLYMVQFYTGCSVIFALSSQKKDLKILKTVECFHSHVKILLSDPIERERYFKEEFPVEYGQKFDQELEKLLWEFLIRLDQFFPVPNLAQTVSWLSEVPLVLEECARAATQPQLLKILLEHQTCLGHLETAASLPPNMGDSILASLSLPPSGRAPSDQPTASKTTAMDHSATSGSYDIQTRHNAPIVSPIFGLISNDDIPIMSSAKRSQKSGENSEFTGLKQKQISKHNGEKEDTEEDVSMSKKTSGMKRKQPDEEDSEEDEEVLRLVRCGKKRSLENAARRSYRTNKNEEDEGQMSRTVLETRMAQHGVKNLPDDPSLSSVYASCLSSQPRVNIEKLSLTSVSTHTGDEAFDEQQQQTPRRKSPVKSSLCVCHPQLFVKRYYKTKHGTYVPTLREFWKPGMNRRNLLSSTSKRR
uniref:TERF1 (TRF1)-interacting nuclear factor 2 n=1 Tax=Sphaeramia orbicularis TaxID=375764 RepID=A0A672YWV2_9TELE